MTDSARPTPEGAHRHRCLRCKQEFLCQTPGVCEAGTDVLPRIVLSDGTVVDHCEWQPVARFREKLCYSCETGMQRPVEFFVCDTCGDFGSRPDSPQSALVNKVELSGYARGLASRGAPEGGAPSAAAIEAARDSVIDCGLALGSGEGAIHPDQLKAIVSAAYAIDGAALTAEVARAHETNRRLNRRCSQLEQGLAEKLDAAKRSGGSLGRSLANAGYVMIERERDALRAALIRAHGCATLRPDGTCDGCFVSEALSGVAPEGREPPSQRSPTGSEGPVIPHPDAVNVPPPVGDAMAEGREPPQGPWEVQRVEQLRDDFVWIVENGPPRSGQLKAHIFESEREALAVRDALNRVAQEAR